MASNNRPPHNSAGAGVHYHSLDVRDGKRLESVLQDIRSTLGPVRAVIHGAGVIDDRRIVDKSLEQFNRVYDTKVLGLRSLLSATRQDPLRYLVLFSSIAARFGNQGQVDYAMANEVLNKTARREFLRRRQCHVISINWGPWDGGMVSSSLKREFTRNHVGLIPLQAGAACLVQELTQPSGHPIEIIIEAASDVQHAAAGSETAPPRPQKAAETEAAGLSLLFKQEIDTRKYPILDAHKLDGKPVVPFALMTEWFGHGALHENPGLLLHGIDDMRILQGIKLEKPRKVIRLFAGKANKKGTLYEVPVELRDGILEGMDVIHSRAKAILVDAMPDPPPLTIQDNFFEGGYRRSIEEISEKILFHAAPQPAQWMKAPLRSSWISDPLALDCAFQLATLWCYEETGSVSLPNYCKQYRQYCTKFPADGITAILEVRDVSAHKMTGDITLLSGEKSIVARLTGYEAVIDPSLYRAFKPDLVQNIK
ncbi:MAG: SDR family oxidoreductase [Deltaproteobacteria bacterium]